MVEDQQIAILDDELVGALDALDVPFLTGGIQNDPARALSPAALMAGLAQSEDARVRSAIIPLLLRHPELANEARVAAARLDGEARATLQLFYTAALLLQKKYAGRLQNLFGVQGELPDLFSRELSLEVRDDVRQSLVQVGERNAKATGLELNWVGTYEHAARTWLEYLEWQRKRKERVWQAN